MKFDKCVICDYNELEGSQYGNISPFVNGSVKPREDGELLCDDCYRSISEAIQYFIEEEIEEEPEFEPETTEDPPVLP